MNITCPSCHSTIAMDDVNVSTDIALCRSCQKTFSFSQIIDHSTTDGPDLAAPPQGAWFEQLPNGFRVGASTRSWAALFIVPFTCIWSGGSLGAIYGTQIMSGHFVPFASLFGLPFLVGSVFLVGTAAMMTAGKVEVVQSGENLSVFMGVGPLGWARNFMWTDFNSVREGFSRNGFNWGNQRQRIVLEGKRRVTFGSMWSEERRYFVLSVLRKMLSSRNRIPSPIMAPQFRG